MAATNASTSTAQVEAPEDDGAKATKEHQAIEREYLETGHVKAGHSLRYVADGKGGSKALIEKV